MTVWSGIITLLVLGLIVSILWWAGSAYRNRGQQIVDDLGVRPPAEPSEGPPERRTERP